jgi:hypothetical protein
MFRAGLMLLLITSFTYRGAAQYFSSYNPNEEIFGREVKLIDEFIDRFNADSSTAIIKQFAREHKGGYIPRSVLIVSLFDLSNNGFNDQDKDLKAFFRQVLDPTHPVTLAFTDTDWYAYSTAVFSSHGKLVEIPLVLQVASQGDEWSKWMIAGVGHSLPCSDPMPSISPFKAIANPPKFIATSANALNFSELHFLLTRQLQPGYYFTPQAAASPSGSQFIAQVQSGELTFCYVKKISYHFYKADGWIFKVDRFKRQTNNSGWLISDIHKVTTDEKRRARKTLLNL